MAHLTRPAQLPSMPFTLPNGFILTAQSGGHLHFPRLPFPIPFWSAPDSALFHSLLAIGSCLLTPTTLSIFAPGDPTPVLVGSKRASENVWRLHIPTPPPFHPPDTPHISHVPSPPIAAFSINPTVPLISNLKDASFTTYISRALGFPSNTILLNAPSWRHPPRIHQNPRPHHQTSPPQPPPNLYPPPSATSTSSAKISALPKPHPCPRHSSFFHPFPLDPTSLDCPPFIRTFSRDESAVSDLTGQLPVESRRSNKNILYYRIPGLHPLHPPKIKICTTSHLLPQS